MEENTIIKIRIPVEKCLCKNQTFLVNQIETDLVFTCTKCSQLFVISNIERKLKNGA